MMIMIIRIRIIELKGAVRDFCKLLTAPRTVSNKCPWRNRMQITRITPSRAGIAQLVMLGLAVHSVEGSILLWGHFPVERIFPLELTWVQTPFPPKLLRMRVLTEV